MRKLFASSLLLTLLLALVLVACNLTTELSPPLPAETEIVISTSAALNPAATPVPARLLTICMGQEPASLFLYADGSLAARAIRQAIYDGPVDVLGFAFSPTILQKIPNLAEGDVTFEPMTVEPGKLIANSDGKLVNLGEGVNYTPAGCSDLSCTQTYSGQDAVQMDQQVVRFQLRPGLQWSDGAPLTADDSSYSFEVAQSLYPQARAELIAYTSSYQSLDEQTIEWRGVPGYRQADYTGNFFTPLPRHAWGALPPDELLNAEISNRRPLGWGPYMIEEWTQGDHISFSRNPNYFRSAESLPAFDRLVFRFVASKEDALAALQAGECDFLDETTMLETHTSELDALQQSGRARVVSVAGSAWEHLDFGISSLNPSLLPLFQSKEIRQAVAMCVDRQRLVDELFAGKTSVLDSYVSPEHPLYNAQARQYRFDPQAGAALLDSLGWLDLDSDPATPRLAQGVSGVPDGTPFQFSLLTTDETEKQRAAQIIVESLAQCGLAVEISSQPWEVLYASGPEGQVFGRNFSLVQFGWTSSISPPCSLYTTQEIPGPYPQHPKGWGGANASGYSNPDYDRLCQQALSVLPDLPEHAAAHQGAQAIFAEDLPALPLYLRLRLVAMRPDMCGVVLDPSADSSLWNLENFDYGESCPD